MIKNYLKTAYRNLSRNRAYTILNVLGLALGIGCALVIYKVINYENSFDKHQSNYDNIYRIVGETVRPNRVDKGMGTPHPLGKAIIEDYAEIKEVARTHSIGSAQIDIGKGENLKKFLIEEKIAFVDPSFFKIFDVDFVAGDKAKALQKPNTAVLSVDLVEQFFQLDENQASQALGKTIGFGPIKDFEVVGVIANPPEATNFAFEMLLEYEGQNHNEINPYYYDGTQWNSTSSNTNTYLLTGDQFDPADFDQQLIGLVTKYYSAETAKLKFFITQPLAAIHFDDDFGNYSYTTPRVLLTAFSLIAIFLVLTACINFINLATAQAANRSKEIGIRKAIGGYKTQIIIQFFAEVTLITFVAVVASLAISESLFVYLEDVIGKRLTVDLFTNFQTIAFCGFVLIVVSFMSGFYPSILLSRMNTVMALKNKITAKNSSGGLNLRKALVVAQFAISQFLIIGTVIITAQMDYFLAKDLGFEEEAIVKSYLPERNLEKNKRFRQVLMENPEVENVTFAISSPTGNSDTNSDFNYAPLESENDYHANYKCVDENYMDFYGLELLAGRNIRNSDSTNYIVVNEKVADLMGFQNNYDAVIGERLSSGWGMNLKIVGVMKNFHSQSLNEDFQYVFLLNEPDVFYEVAMKSSKGSDIRKAVTKFEIAWEEVFPEYVADWQFFDEELASRYEQEQSMASLMRTFSFVAIIIGCLGLYGLIAFIAGNRRKEVGIRKVLGASIYSIISRFAFEILTLVIISFVIAAPLSYFLLNGWLDNYQFRIEMGANFFISAFAVTLLVAVATVSYKTISTALINPAKTLKDE